MGYGDEIMITGYAKELKRKYPNHQIVAGNKEKGIIVDTVIFNNNPYIKRFSELKNTQTIWIDSYTGCRPYFIKETEEKYYWNEKHKTIPGELYFSEEEESFSSNTIINAKKWWRERNVNGYKKIIFIEPSRIKTIKNNVSKNRGWEINKWQSFINMYSNKYLFIQSIYRDSDTLDGVYAFKSSFREACAVLKKCDYTVGGEGGFTHAAAALNKKGLYIYGGWVDPNITGYSDHKNIYIDIEGSPCGMKTECEHCKRCNKIMTVDMIAKNFLEMVSA
jgi:ADP-heptose:LPS heptosyltransferase